MTREEQIQTLGDLLILETAAQQLSDGLNKAKTTKFRRPPKAPEKPKESIPSMPNEGLSAGKIAAIVIASLIISLVLSVVLSTDLVLAIPVIVLVILIVVRNTKRRKAMKQLEEGCRATNERLQKEYEYKLAKYKSSLASYTTERKAWEEEHEALIKEYTEQFESISAELKDLYDSTKLIPIQYRKPDAIGYIYDFMSTSEAEIQQGLVSYDNYVQQRLTQTHINEQQIANELAARRINEQQIANEIAAKSVSEQQRANSIAAYQAELSEEANYIAERTRRQQNMANAIAIIQRGITNSLLSDE